MVEPISSKNATTRQSITPSAASGIVISAPGAPSIGTVVSPATQAREEEMRARYADIEARYGRSKYVGYRRGEMAPKPRPETPVSDVYAIQMRPRQPVPGTPLEPLLIAKEQTAVESWIGEETVRAINLESGLKYESQMRAYDESLREAAKRQAEADRIWQEQRQKDIEAQKYGYPTYESLMRAIQEEKLIRHLNELGAELTNVQLSAQTAVRENIPAPEYMPTLQAQSANIAAIQSQLESGWGVTIPGASEYVSKIRNIMDLRASAAPVTVAAAPETPTPLGFQVTVYPPLKLGDEPLPPINRAAIALEPYTSYVAGLREKTKIESPAIEPGIQLVQSTARFIERSPLRPFYRVTPLPLALIVSEQLIREPTRPVTAIMEMPAETAIGVYTIGTETIPSVIENPAQVLGFPEALAKGIATEVSTDPVGFLTKMGVSALVSPPIISAGEKATAPMVSGAREISILARTEPELRPFVKGSSQIGRYSREVYSPIEKVPEIERVLNIGENAPTVLKELKTEPHALYGSVVETGQMPAKVSLEKTGRVYTPIPSDIDVFVAEPAKTAERIAKALGPEYTTEGATVVREIAPGQRVHAVDIHPFPENYPIKGIKQPDIPLTAGESEVIVAPKLPFDFMPRELLTREGVTQEYLYTQVQRKATSVIGRPESLLKWSPGPPPHRIKDIGSLLTDTDYLISSLKKEAAGLSGIRRLTAERKIRKLSEGYELVAGTELGQAGLEAVRGLPPGSVKPPVIIPVSSTPVSSKVSPLVITSASGLGAGMLSPVTASTASRISESLSSVKVLSPKISPVVTRVSPGIPAGARSPVAITPRAEPSPVLLRAPSLVAGAMPSIGGVTVSPIKISPVVTRVSPAPLSPGKVSPGVVSPGVVSPSIISSPMIAGGEGPGVSPLITRPKKVIQGEEERPHRYPWEEWLIHYRSEPTFEMGFESAYLGLPDLPRTGTVIVKNIERITRGPAPIKKVIPVERVGEPLTFGPITTKKRGARKK